ncbi:MAG: replication initiator protein A [Methylobacterium sp.]|nr:replication initiator protein A [Cupriavidus sp.]MCA3671911.1 replication initiator protein A [Methylobacterium sp.]MCA3676855.1 replication initiator protein A [Methylobacterium sp.]MCA3681291.1 replication initiator protein A [Methylobacterium sp.]MCA3682605.1 replication initiator protein A [Methylobacterium sp.]
MDTSKIANPVLRASLENIGRILTERDAEREQARSEDATTRRSAPANDNQPDFFVPSVYDVPVKDGIGLMDVAVFRLSKSQKRAGEILRHQYGDAIIEVRSGPDGLATIYDYDIVLMMISHLAEEAKFHRQGRGPLPAKVFRPHASEIFKFIRVEHGGASYHYLEQALDRLKGTSIKIIATRQRSRRAGTFSLISDYEIVSRTETGRIASVDIVIPDWIYAGVLAHKMPEVLTLNPDYFLIEKGLARFLYRLARKAAGQGEAIYSLQTIYARTGSTRAFKKFCFDLRALVRANDLPDYALELIDGAEGGLLRMTHRAPALPEASVA